MPMILKKYSLKTKKTLLQDVDIEFEKGTINHLLGQNGTGKSCFAKSIIGRFKYSGEIEKTTNNIVLIGSYSNIPQEIRVKDLINIVYKHCGVKDELYYKLKIENLNPNNKIKHLSDGEYQKIKLFYYFASLPEIVILDEFTNALDKDTCDDIYLFLNTYIKKYTEKTIINITHNLMDLNHMPGTYYLINEKKIKKMASRESIINSYIEGV